MSLLLILLMLRMARRPLILKRKRRRQVYRWSTRQPCTESIRIWLVLRMRRALLKEKLAAAQVKSLIPR